MQVMGKTLTGKRRILKWTYDGSPYNNPPTGLIFVPTGQNQTADLAYINHGYYIEGTYDHTVTNTSDISELNGDTTSETTTWYDLSGRKLNGKPTKKGIYINNERKYIVK